MERVRSLGDFEAVLFDVDGTLVDSVEMIVLGLGDTLEAFAGARPPREEIRRRIGMPLRTQFPDYGVIEPGSPRLDEMIQHAVTSMERHADRERPFPAAIETLRLCHERGIRTALVTSKSRAELEPFLRRFEPARYADTLVSASDVRHPKPHPESALRACALLEVSPSRAAMVGDSVFDIRCARDAGLTAIAVGYGAASAEQLQAAHPDLYFGTPDELLHWARLSLSPLSCPARRS